MTSPYLLNGRIASRAQVVRAIVRRWPLAQLLRQIEQIRRSGHGRPLACVYVAVMRADVGRRAREGA